VIARSPRDLLRFTIDMQIIFTDLDGTLLDHETYSWEAARPAIERLNLRDLPWVMVTSKTRAEVEWWRKQMDNRHPFVVENGAAAFVPLDYFPFPVPGAARRDNYEVLESGMKYHDLVSCLKEASRRSRCRVLGFNEMSPAEVSFTCNLPLEQAALAKVREYDEPFRILDLNRAAQLLHAIEKQGLRWTKGGRFWHITCENDKARAVTMLQQLFERVYGPVATIGLGDAPNDVPFLNVVTFPVLIRSRGSARLKAAVPRGILTDQPGPAGCNEILLKMIPQ
jgi:mannosyl-3-phosphoglycerate phosphatase